MGTSTAYSNLPGEISGASQNPSDFFPLSLYIHIPWCLKKCPYCDFNSHVSSSSLPEENYLECLLGELKIYRTLLESRPLVSVFIGGGTPSLFSPQTYDRLFNTLRKWLSVPKNLEITLEANPGTAEQTRFRHYREIGINRLSLGVQSFQDNKLITLGRIHNGSEALAAIRMAQTAGFENINVDIMYGLPAQLPAEAYEDLQTACNNGINHISWYQLTLEPGTLFYKKPPPLPADEKIWEIQNHGQNLLAQAGFQSYEISAYGKSGTRCRHNLNYWEFGDYLGIGAGAHSKLTDQQTHSVTRWSNLKNPKQYLSSQNPRQDMHTVTESELPLEFFMNAFRLKTPITFDLFTQRTGLPVTSILPKIQHAQKLGLLHTTTHTLYPTALGTRFLNDLLQLFIPENSTQR